MRLTKNEFIYMINKYREMYNEDLDICKAMDIVEWVPSDWLNEYYAMINILSDAKEHEDIGTLIDYFVFELDFGELWEEGYYTDNGVDIKLETAGDLYDALVGEQNERPSEN